MPLLCFVRYLYPRNRRLQCVHVFSTQQHVSQHSNMENPSLAESLEQQLQELGENEQRILRVLQDLQGSVVQLSQQTADTSWTTCTQQHQNQLQRLRYVRVLRAKEAGPLACGLTPAEVEAVLQCERGAVRHVEPQRDNAKGKQRVTVRSAQRRQRQQHITAFRAGATQLMQSLTYGAHACITRSWTWPFRFSELPGGSVGGGM